MAAEDLASSGYLDPLRDALDSSFTSTDPSLRAPEPSSEAQGSTAPKSETPVPAQQGSSSDAPPAADDGWKVEYDERLAAWRAEAAVARQKAEEERARWGAIRDTERAAADSRRKEEQAAAEQRGRESAFSSGEWEAAGSSSAGVSGSARESADAALEGREGVTRARLGEAHIAAEVELLGVPLEGSEGEPSVADARDLTTSEPEGTGHMFSSDFPSVVSLGSTPPTIPSLFQTDTDSPVEVSNGEDKSSPDADESSLNESAPSRRRPGGSRPTASASAAAAAVASAQAAQRSDDKRAAEKEARAVAAAAEVPKSLALSVFSPGLPWRARLIALAGTLAINLALPFLNGIMLGFGEIFAKNYIAVWIGWSKRPKGAVTAVGVRY
ncbi:hypothetical protein CALCODRAFT_56245 [Calocera cornea HHB12733]|uniref:TOM13-domain-containing protein n=1 Tax=Calocera cornea HHB12733 TaxID=1353952 RepID=A0A165DPF0_9BASI|nr:hypothetical protein CALCODRAFT_56245 [Calocera cornea HHB12733]